MGRRTTAGRTHITGDTHTRLAATVLQLTLVMTIALGAAAHLGHLTTDGVLETLRHGSRDTLASTPLILLGVLAGLEVAATLRRRLRIVAPMLEIVIISQSIALWTVLMLVPGAVLHGRLLDNEAVTIRHALGDGAGVTSAAFATALAAVILIRVPLRIRPGSWTEALAVAGARMVPTLRRPDPRQLLGLRNILIAALLMASSGLLIPFVPSQPAVAVGSGQSCDAGTAQRTYDVTAINVVIPRNRWGDVDPHGQIFVLDQDKEAVRHWATPLVDPIADDPAAGRRLRPRPLVLRANEGECVAITLSNELDQQALVPDASPTAYGSVELGGEGLPLAGTQWVSLQINGVSFSVDTPGDGAIGYGADTGVAPGGTPQTYYLRAPSDEGVHFFRDGATLAGSEADGGSTGHGLYGAFVVEPAGARWFDPVSGAELSTPTPYADVADQSGELYLDAIIVPPGTGSYAIDSNVLDLGAPDIVAFRETIQISQDEMPGVHLQNCDLAAADAGNIVDGRPVRDDCTDAHTTTPNSFQFGLGLGFNYAEEHLLLRQHEINRCPDCVGEETWLSSWPYGDPGLVKLASGFGPWYPRWHPWYDGGSDGVGANNGQQNFDNTDDPEDCGLTNGCYTANVPHSYQYDAHKIRFVHAGPKETHVFHMHAHQWLTDPQDIGASGTTPGTPDDAHKPEATTIDSQTYGPGEGFTIDLLFGAGSKPGTVGDSIFHCHLYPHFAEGFWSLFRVHDVLEDGANITPDGIKVRSLQPLPDRTDAPTSASALDPGYPRFIPGEEGWRSPQPIGGISEPIPGTVDDPDTIVREDLEPATRIVAGVGLEQPLQEIVVGAPTDPPPPAPMFQLRFGSADSDPLSVGASADEVEAALERLGPVGDVTVTGDGTPASPYTVQFLILDNANPASSIQIELIPSGGATGSVSATWDDDGPLEASATSLAYRLSLERAAVLQSHNDGIYDASEAPWTPLAEAGAQEVAPDRYNKPGAPLVDPCPEGVREITYNVSMVQLDITYNDNGWHDTQGRMLVLNDDLPDILAGTKPIEPFFFRANSGDCINFNMTNLMPNWFGNDDFLEMVQTNMAGQHIHLVKFDVTGSDGSSNGWNYQQAAFSEAQRLYDDAVVSGDPLAAHPELDHLGAGVQATCSPDLFDGADLVADGCRIALPSDWNPTWTCQAAGRCPAGQTISERWYVDYDLRTIFTHDHHFPAEDQNRGLFAALVVEPAGMDVRDPHSGEYKQPINDPSHGPACVDACNANAVGTSNDIIGPAADDDFREFSLAIQDFVSLYRPCSVCDPSVIAGEEPVAPPGEPELFPSDDPGVMGINYRNAPFVIRDSVGGVPTDPAYVFSSRVHGDPDTPVLEAYAGDPVRARLIQGAQEEQHVVQIHGMNWLQEPDDPESPRVNATPIGISEAFNFEMPALDCGVEEECVGDYLYGGTATDDMWAGAWGLMRVYGKGIKRLLPLPDNLAQVVNGNTSFAVSGTPPPKANKPGTPCPQGAPVRSYDVIAVDAPITYNSDGDHDPYGLVYAALTPGETPEAGATRVRSENPDPMVLRAHEGDCIEVTLTNKIDPTGAFATEHAPHGSDQSTGGDGFDPPLVLEPPAGTPAGLRVSLHADLLRYDVRGSDGATVGFNRDQTVGPEDSITYRWYAYDVSPGELGALNLTDYGDVRGHRHHGLFAGLVVEPRGSTWADPITGEVGTTSAQADIRVVDSSTEATDFREFVTFYQDGLNLRDAAGRPLPDPFDHLPTPEEPVGALADSEDRGEKALNYRNESFHHRLDQEPGAAHDSLPGFDLAHVFSSTEHGDPDTPTFRAYAGDDIRWRVLQGADKPRQHTFGIGGHSWLRQPNDSESETETIGAQGAMSVGRAFNIHTTAGGTTGAVGDFRYGDQVLDHKLSGGWWGLLRVYDGPGQIPATEFVDPDDPSAAGNTPILPLGANTVTVTVSTDHDGDGKIDKDDDPADGVSLGLAVQVDGREFPVGADGRAHVPVTPGLIDLELTAGPDVAITGSASTTVDATHQGIAPTAEFTVTRLGEITVQGLEDPNGDDLDDATGTLAGWSVSISKGTTTLQETTGVDGSVTFDGLLPGSWKVAVAAPAGWKLTTSPPTVNLVENANETVQVGAALVAGVSVHLYNDSDSSTQQGPGERNLAGWTVIASPLDATIGQPDVQVVSNAAGAATFEGLAAGTYAIEVQPRDVPASDWNITGRKVEVLSTAPQTFGAGVPECAVHRCTTQAFQASTTVMDVGFHNPNVWVTLRLFDDSDNDGVRDAKETKLTGFPVEVWRNGVRAATTVVGNNGSVSHYGLPGNYSIRIQEPADNGSIHWFLTPMSASTSLAAPTWQSVAVPSTRAGDTADISRGAIQPGTVSARVFHDRDGDAIWDDDLNEEPLGGRSVRLYAAKGNTKAPLATAFTNSAGIATFQVGANTDFRLEVLTPLGWQATTPLGSNGAGAIAPIRSDSDLTKSVFLEFGQREVVDTTPPPTPIPTPPGGSYDGSVEVGLTSETGAQIRYRLDGGDPTLNGVLYTGPLTLGVGAWELRAVAYDAAGNRSAILSATYVVTSVAGPPDAMLALSSLQIVDAQTSSGDVGSLAADDGVELTLASRRQGKNEVTAFEASGSVVVGTVSQLDISFAPHQTTSGVTQRLLLLNLQSASWEPVWSTSSPTAGNPMVITVSGDPNRFVSSTGELRARVESQARLTSHQMGVDVLWFRLKQS